LGALIVGGAVTAPCQAQVNADKQGLGSKEGEGAYGSNFRGFNQSPWFSNPSVRQQLQLNDDQYDKLIKAYSQSWSRFNEGITGLDKGLAEQERLQRQRGLTESFNKEFGSAVDETLPEKMARQRYNQMDWQYRGYGAFNDPIIQQKLNLTNEQRQKFSIYDSEWGEQISTWRSEYPRDREGVDNRYRDARLEWQRRIDSTLTPEQRTIWQDMSGKPFEFPADVYFENNARSKSSLKAGSR